MTHKDDPPRAQRSAVARWNDAVHEAHAGDGGASEELDASDEEIERELRAAGVDLGAEDAKADATYEAVVAAVERATRDPVEDAPGSEVAWVASTARPRVTSLPRKRSRVVWLAWGIAAASAAGGAAYVAAHPHAPPQPPRHEPPVVEPVEPDPTAIPSVAPPPPLTPPPTHDKADKKAPR